MAMTLWGAVALVPAIIARRAATGHGADHALLGMYSAIALPFLAYTVLSGVLGRDGLGRSGLVLANFGASPGRVAIFAVTVAVSASGFLGGGLGALVDALAHGPLDPPLAQDLARAFAGGALGGAAYAAFFALGASFGARGFGRSVLLVLDWIFGAGTSASALFTPRAHVRSLLGGSAPLDVPGRASFAALVIMVVAFTLLAAARASRTRWAPARG
jgi:hypothetical protein